MKDTIKLLSCDSKTMRPESTISGATQSATSSTKFYSCDIVPSGKICSFFCTNCTKMYSAQVNGQITELTVLLTVQYHLSPPKSSPADGLWPSLSSWQVVFLVHSVFHPCREVSQESQLQEHDYLATMLRRVV